MDNTRRIPAPANPQLCSFTRSVPLTRKKTRTYKPKTVDAEPYVELVSNEGDVVQLSIAEAIAMARLYGGEELRDLKAPRELIGKTRQHEIDKTIPTLLAKLGLIDSSPIPSLEVGG